MVHDPTNILKYIITPSSVKLLVDDGRSLVVRDNVWGKCYCICDCIAMKKILEYTLNIHQLHCWSQELLGYEFAMIHQATSMMKDFDGLSRHIDILIHRYLTQSSSIHLADIAKRPFTYSFNSFIFCSNLNRVTASDITITTKASSTFSSLLIIQYSPLHFTLLPHPFFNHIPFQSLLHIPITVLFPLKTLFYSLLTQLLPLSVHYFLFGLEERLPTSDSKQTCTIIVLLPSSTNLLYHNIKNFHIFSSL